MISTQLIKYPPALSVQNCIKPNTCALEVISNLNLIHNPHRIKRRPDHVMIPATNPDQYLQQLKTNPNPVINMDYYLHYVS